jgi:hypothetical protein
MMINTLLQPFPVALRSLSSLYSAYPIDAHFSSITVVTGAVVEPLLICSCPITGKSLNRAVSFAKK